MISYGEQVFPRVKERCSSKHWFSSDDINALEELTGRLRRLKENVGFITNRVTAIQAGLDSWQAEQINRKLYYLSFLSIALLPLSIITGGNLSLQSKLLRSLYQMINVTQSWRMKWIVLMKAPLASIWKKHPVVQVVWMLLQLLYLFALQYASSLTWLQ